MLLYFSAMRQMQMFNQYYILRNSWGMSGYMYFARNNNNMCGIATDAIFPNVVVSGSSSTSAPPTTTTSSSKTSSQKN